MDYPFTFRNCLQQNIFNILSDLSKTLFVLTDMYVLQIIILVDLEIFFFSSWFEINNNVTYDVDVLSTVSHVLNHSTNANVLALNYRYKMTGVDFWCICEKFQYC